MSSFHRPGASEALSRGRWGLVAVLAPLFLLTGLGVRGLQVSRQQTLEAARRQSARSLDQILPPLSDGWQKLFQATPELRFYPVPPLPGPPTEAQSLYLRAVEVADEQPRATAVAILAKLESESPDAVASSGVPLLPLVEWALLRRETDPAARAARADVLGRVTVETHPSLLTPELLANVAGWLRDQGETSALLEGWQQRWLQDERRRAAMRLRPELLGNDLSPLHTWITDTDGDRWWVERDGDEKDRSLRVWSWQELSRWARPLCTATSVSPWPDYATPSLALDGVELLPPVPAITTAASGSSPMALATARPVDTALVFDLVLTAPQRLYAQQHQQTVWLAALLVCAFGAALTGIVAMRRALSREQQLGWLKSDFVASVSHELRTPVAAMRLLAENLESGTITVESRRSEYHRLIAEECRRLSALIDNVLDFARIEQNCRVYDFAETDAAELVRDALQFLEPRLAERCQRCEPMWPPVPLEPAPICDGLAVRQALVNLLENASKFSPPNTVIHVGLSMLTPDTWTLTVRDEGPGIPVAEHRRVFERFYRLGSELRRETQGAGIGLSIVQHIAHGHGGRVELLSRPGSGSEFRLVLPLRPPGSV